MWVFNSYVNVSKITMGMGKSSINEPCSIAMLATLVYQRVQNIHIESNFCLQIPRHVGKTIINHPQVITINGWDSNHQKWGG